MKRVWGLCLIVAALGLVQPVTAADIKVMTQNQYLGADLTPLFTASSAAMFNEEAVQALRQVAANRPAERIKMLALEIGLQWPALVGLQEVYLFQCTDYAGRIPGTGCDDPTIRDAFVDHLQGTLKALRGIYRARAIVTNLNLTPGIPISINGVPILVRVVDRDVILARFDVQASPVDFAEFQEYGVCTKPSDQGCNYTVGLPVPTPFGVTINVERGYVGVDAMVDGKAYRFVTTHLEQKYGPSDASVIQVAQATELVHTLQATTPRDRSLLVVGDMNSSPVDPFIFGYPTPYMQFLAAGYVDAWTLRPVKLSGFTCCQLADLSNPRSALYERVDMIFSLEAPERVEHASVVGDSVLEKTPPFWRGLWPSDHGAVAAELEFR
jgi:hypothetical protein